MLHRYHYFIIRVILLSNIPYYLFVFVTSVCWHFFVFRNSVETLCISWAFSLVEYVAVWALKIPVPHTDVLKTHESQSVSTKLLESKRIGSEHLTQTLTNIHFTFSVQRQFIGNNFFYLILLKRLHYLPHPKKHFKRLISSLQL